MKKVNWAYLKRRVLRFVINFVWSNGLRNAIWQGRVKEYYEHKRYFKTQFKKDDEGSFKHTLAFVAIVKNEGLYLAEWIEYHKLVGVEKFYIYDNDSTDNIRDVLAPYIARGDVEYMFWSGKCQQIMAYNFALKKHRMDTRWMGFIDLDEFVVPLQKLTISEVLEDYKGHVGLAMNWLIYGDNGHKTRTDGLVIERFTAHALQAHPWVKTIINPRAAFAMKVHHGVFIGNQAAVNEMGRKCRQCIRKPSISTIRINHYWGKTWEEYQQKRARGQADRYNLLPVDDSRFSEYNRNEVQDFVMEKDVPIVTKNIEKTRCKIKVF